jgi:AhpD family alkylhydroperoxidase
MCCSTGVCGPEVDPILPRFAADLDWLANHGVQVQRFNLAQQAAAFSENQLVMKSLKEVGNEVLPLILVDGAIASQGRYPTRDELSKMASLSSASESLLSDAVKELVAISAAIASNCEPCFKFHFDKARKLGVSKADMRAAVSIAQAVKDSPARAMIELADRHLNELPSPAAGKRLPVSSCCGSSGDDGGTPKTGGCC